MKELAQLVLENTVAGKIDRRLAGEILGLLKKNHKGSKNVAIIGISLQFPLANNPKEYWDILAGGGDCIRAVPPLREADCKNTFRLLNPGDPNPEFIKCGYLEEIDKFDYSLFRLTPKEAQLMDPHQRLFLQAAYSAIEDAGYGGMKLSGSNTGIYVGYNSWPIYNMMANALKETPEMILIGNTPSLIPSRVSYLLNLRGPSMLVDTACSASLVAIHQAYQAVRNGECDLAIAGGVKIHLNPNKNLISLGNEAADGRSKTFDDQSDGIGWGEGVGAVLLKPLDKAVQDYDHIYAVIKGSALNQDGAGAEITAAVHAQEEVILAAWRDAEIDPETVTYIEAHGTGDKLEDTLEVEAMGRAFSRSTNRKQFCAIGSVKTNFGNLDSASGIASLLKAVLALGKKQLPPTIHFQQPNRQISFEDLPVFVNDQLYDWECGPSPRRCGISSFSLRGTNCHLILEEAPQTGSAEETGQSLPRVLALSAVTTAGLKALLRAYQTYLEGETDLDSDALCYTANTGRGHYQQRLLIFFRDHADLRAKMAQLTQNELEGWNGPEIWYGRHQLIAGNKKSKAAGELTREEKQSLNSIATLVSEAIATQPEMDQEQLIPQLFELSRLYIKGADFKWERLYQNAPRQKISIPGYPFQPERCWLEIELYKTIRPENRARLKGRVEYSATEERLAGLWSEILGFTEIAVTTDFYQLGGDSITAVILAMRIHQEFDVELSIGQLLESSTIETQAELVGKAPKSRYAAIEAVPEKQYYPVSSAQKRLLLIDKFTEVNTSYNNPSLLEVTGAFKREKFEKIIGQLIERHEAFRTSFEFVAGEPVQRIHSRVAFRSNYLEVEQKEAESTRDLIAEVIREFIQPFDLSQAPLLRVGLVKLGDERHLLLFDMHHIITDETSIHILMRDFAALYNGEPLENLRIQYKDFSEWQHRLFHGQIIKCQERYWLNQFAGEIPVLELPTDYPRPAVKNFAGAVVHFELDRGLTESLNQLAVQSGATLFIILLGIYTILLSKYSGQDDIVVGTPILGRPHADLQNIIGVFVNTLALRNQPQGSKTFREYLNDVKHSALQAYDNQDYPFEELVEKLSLKRDLSRNPLFDSMFMLQNLEMPVAQINNLQFNPYPINNYIAKFDLTLQASEIEKKLYFSIEYGTKLFKRETIERMAGHFQELIKIVTAQPEIKLSGIEMLTEDEKENVQHIVLNFNEDLGNE